MDQIIAANGLTVTMEAMLNHPVLKKDIDELSFTRSTSQPDTMVRAGLNLLRKMILNDAHGYEERRVTLRKAGVLQVLVPVVAAFRALSCAALRPASSCAALRPASKLLVAPRFSTQAPSRARPSGPLLQCGCMQWEYVCWATVEALFDSLCFEFPPRR